MFLAMDTEADTLRTSWTLVARLKNLGDQQSWDEFDALYRPLILGVAVKAGLRDDEAQDVVQETMTVMTKHIQDFVAEPARGSFRSWLLTIARRRICDQFGKRLPVVAGEAPTSGTARTPTVERMPNPTEADLEALCDLEWARHLRETALRELQFAVKPEHYQIFHLLTLEQRPIDVVARMVGRNLAQIYLIRHRVGNKLKKIVRRLEKELG
jgi:RNA polymerase sigma-70 factor (ECF subfamily)